MGTLSRKWRMGAQWSHLDVASGRWKSARAAGKVDCRRAAPGAIDCRRDAAVATDAARARPSITQQGSSRGAAAFLGDRCLVWGGEARSEAFPFPSTRTGVARGRERNGNVRGFRQSKSETFSLSEPPGFWPQNEGGGPLSGRVRLRG